MNSKTRPMMGNEAIAQGAWEAGVRVASAYPGTPSTEILENIAKYPETDIYAQWATNEKVAFDVASGASFSGVRSFVAMKHVGLNVASDTLMSQTYIGINGGMVIVVCDDPGIHSSQNEQDTRMYSRLAMVPTLEPSDAQEALDFVKLGYELSEEFDTPVILRSTTRLCHTRSLVQPGKRLPPKPLGFLEDPKKNVMIPGHSRLRHPKLLERESKLKAYFDSSDIIRWDEGSPDYGVITLGPSFTYVKEVLPDASVLKLGASYPIPEQRIREFCKSVKRVFVVEELEPVVENEMRGMGLEVEGKKYFSRLGEFSPETVRTGFEDAGIVQTKKKKVSVKIKPVVRPPVLCAGCSHMSSYLVMNTVDARVAGDIGCYTLAAVEPLSAIDTTVAMGSSIANAVGMAKAGTETKPIVATIGDSTFLHSGIPPLIDAVYNDADITVLLLDNKIVAMTGGQNHPGTGITLRGEKSHKVEYEEIVRATGVKWVKTVDSYDMGAMLRTIREAIAFKGVAVVISDRPCVLDPVRLRGAPMEVDVLACTGCQSCMNLGCPALSWSDELFEGHHKVKISVSGCIGCSMCAQVCPTDCIKPAAKIAL